MNDTSGKKNTRSSWMRWLGTFAALALIGYLLSQRWDDVRDAVQQISLAQFLLASGFMLLSRFMVVGRWYVLLRSGGIEITYLDVVRLTFAGLFASNFLPSTVGGDVVRLAGGMQKGFDGSIMAASLVMDRMIGVIGMMFMLPVGIKQIIDSGQLTPISLLWIPFFSTVVSDAGFLQKGLQKVKKVAQKVLQAFKMWARKPKALLGALIFTGAHMLCWFSAMYIVLQDIEDPLSLWMIGGLWSFVYLVTLAPISIGGWGVQEVSITYIFTTFGGISEQHAITLALAIRTLLMVASLPGSAFLSSFMPEIKNIKT